MPTAGCTAVSEGSPEDNEVAGSFLKSVNSSVSC